jgi:hypothetical protein
MLLVLHLSLKLRYSRYNVMTPLFIKTWTSTPLTRRTFFRNSLIYKRYLFITE